MSLSADIFCFSSNACFLHSLLLWSKVRKKLVSNNFPWILEFRDLMISFANDNSMVYLMVTVQWSVTPNASPPNPPNKDDDDDEDKGNPSDRDSESKEDTNKKNAPAAGGGNANHANSGNPGGDPDDSDNDPHDDEMNELFNLLNLLTIIYIPNPYLGILPRLP